eukprot:200150-Amphidinium_carterae.1
MEEPREGYWMRVQRVGQFIVEHPCLVNVCRPPIEHRTALHNTHIRYDGKALSITALDFLKTVHVAEYSGFVVRGK